MQETALYILLAVIAIMSIVGFGVMAYDKRQAINGGWRIPNNHNYILAIVFGAPGVLLAMMVCRHKTKQWPYWLVVIIGLVIDTSLFIAFTAH